MPTVNKKYLDLDGLSYYNGKVQAKINAEKTARTAADTNLQTQINGLTSGSPIPAASTAEMTDTTRIYVNTTDGHWYYWNGSTWLAGGTYQATALGTDSVKLSNLTNNLADGIYNYSTDASKLGCVLFNNQASGYKFTTPMLIKAGTTITLSDTFVANYHWQFKRCNDAGIGIATASPNVNSESTNTTYTFVNDERCVFCWRPIDNNWETTDYTVDKRHNIDNDDITSIKYYYIKSDVFNLIDIDPAYYRSIFLQASTYGVDYYYSANRLSSVKILKSAYDIVIGLKKSGLKFDVSYWDNDTDNATRIQDSGWKTEPFTIPANTYFTILVVYNDNSSFRSVVNWDQLFYINSYADYNYAKQYIDKYIDKHISSVGDEYNYQGVNLDLQYKHGYTYTASTPIPTDYRGMQGFATYGNYIVQLYSNGKIALFNITNNTLEATIGGVSAIGHGDSCQFSNEFYDENDMFPLMYVSTDSQGVQEMSVIRISNTTTATRVKKYQFSSEDGYYCGQSVDFENGIVYNFGYKLDSFYDSTGNSTIVSVYNLNKETPLGNNVYELELMERYEIPFIYCIQGQTFLNGKCWLCSSYRSDIQRSNIVVFDPASKTIVADFPSLPIPLRGEIEGISFVPNSTTGKYYAIVAVNGDPNYWKLTFM